MSCAQEKLQIAVANEIAASVLVPRLIAEALPYRAVSRTVTLDATLRNDAVANALLDFYDAVEMDQSSAADLVAGAEVASRGSSCMDLLCRVWKDMANVRRARADYAGAGEALDRAERYANSTIARSTHRAVVKFGRAALASDMGYKDRALDLINDVVVAFAAAGDTSREMRARLYRMSLQYEQGRLAETLDDSREAARLATMRGEPVEAAKYLANAAACYARLGEYAEARQCYDRAIGVLDRTSDIETAARVRRSAAYLSIRQIGPEAGLSELEAVRETFFDLGLPGVAVRALTDALEIIVEMYPGSDRIVPLCMLIQVEAGRLDLRPDVAKATEQLRLAAVRGELDRDVESAKALLKSVHELIDPDAQLAPSAAN